ncbi:hypothetical protein QJS10_CPB18g01569 [Acorus calamus]|uniref:Uncharacterized protein n=1 Tax=Acorus calamus TaxID=4465 RepID=A0AAV9CNU3_ACOCL|nr:hypothetical protein QJS10_CPB18g01569 [Acorus calamus]
MDPVKDKLVRRTAMVASVTAAYFLLTADYGAQPNALDPDMGGEEVTECPIRSLK